MCCSVVVSVRSLWPAAFTPVYHNNEKEQTLLYLPLLFLLDNAQIGVS
jgi:hypothetical protein